MRFLVIISLMTLICSCTNNRRISERTVKIEFYKDSIKQDKFRRVKCIGQSEKELDLAIKGDTLSIPDSLKLLGNSIDVIFSFADTTVVFKNVNIKAFYVDQNQIWEVAIDHRPYDFGKKFMSKSEIEDSLYHTYIFWYNNVLEYGDGACLFQKK